MKTRQELATEYGIKHPGMGVDHTARAYYQGHKKATESILQQIENQLVQVKVFELESYCHDIIGDLLKKIKEEL